MLLYSASWKGENAAVGLAANVCYLQLGPQTLTALPCSFGEPPPPPLTVFVVQMEPVPLPGSRGGQSEFPVYWLPALLASRYPGGWFRLGPQFVPVRINPGT